MALQLLFSFVRVGDFIPVHQTTAACNVIVGAGNIDFILSAVSTAFMYIFFAPGVFIITSIVVPGTPKELYMYIPYLDREQEDVLCIKYDIMVNIRQKLEYTVSSKGSKSEKKLKKGSREEMYLKSKPGTRRFDDYAVFRCTFNYALKPVVYVLSPLLHGDRIVIWLSKQYFLFLCEQLDHQDTEDNLLLLSTGDPTTDKRAPEKSFRSLCDKFYNPINVKALIDAKLIDEKVVSQTLCSKVCSMIKVDKTLIDEVLIKEYLSQKKQAQEFFSQNKKKVLSQKQEEQQSSTFDVYELGDKIGGDVKDDNYKAFPIFFNLCRCVGDESNVSLSTKKPVAHTASDKHSFTYITLCYWIEADIKLYASTFSSYRNLVETVPGIGVLFNFIIKILSFSVGHLATTVGLSAWLLTAWKVVTLMIVVVVCHILLLIIIHT